LLLVAKDDHRVRIEVGYGLEGVLPDAIANRIVEEDIVPRFRNGDYYGGIAAGVDRISRVIDGEPLPPPHVQPQMHFNIESLLLIGFIMIFVVGGTLRAIFGRVFGSGIVADGTGFALQNRGALFTLDPSSPNALAGHKRPLHTIIPGFMSRGDERIAFGIMGGFNQAQAHAQFVANIADHKMNIQAALEAPRFTKYTLDGCDVEMEDRIAESARKDLESRGHKIELRHGYSSEFGGGQAVRRDFKSGVNSGASDPRKDGEAIPEPPPIK